MTNGESHSISRWAYFDFDEPHSVKEDEASAVNLSQEG